MRTPALALVERYGAIGFRQGSGGEGWLHNAMKE